MITRRRYMGVHGERDWLVSLCNQYGIDYSIAEQAVSAHNVQEAGTACLVGDGTAYIDTGLAVTSTTQYELQAYCATQTSSFAFLGGRYNGDGSLTSSLTLFNIASQGLRLDQKGYLRSYVGTFLNAKKTLKFDGDYTLYIDGIFVEKTNMQTTPVTDTNYRNIYLFGQNTGNVNTNNTSGIHIYKYVRWDNDVVTQLMLPYNGGMVDLVSGQSVTNAASSGAFTYELD